MPKPVSIISVGALNTDISLFGIPSPIPKDEVVFTDKVTINAGGKSRNIAEMMAVLMGKNKIAMIGKTVKDRLGLWKPQLDSLKKVGINTRFITFVSPSPDQEYPPLTIITVDRSGKHQIYVTPNNQVLVPKDIEQAQELFNPVQDNRILAISLEIPLNTVLAAVKKAHAHNVCVFFDPGGIINEETDYTELLQQKMFFIKPNEYETKMLTGTSVRTIISAQKAADIFLKYGIRNILITCGENGAFFCNEQGTQYIPTPQIPASTQKDATGCGDQTMAAICTEWSQGRDIFSACRIGILAGTLQFYKAGVKPLSKAELDYWKKELKYV